jgi:hypothetical protein
MRSKCQGRATILAGLGSHWVLLFAGMFPDLRIKRRGLRHAASYLWWMVAVGVRSGEDRRRRRPVPIRGTALSRWTRGGQGPLRVVTGVQRERSTQPATNEPSADLWTLEGANSGHRHDVQHGRASTAVVRRHGTLRV